LGGKKKTRPHFIDPKGEKKRDNYVKKGLRGPLARERRRENRTVTVTCKGEGAEKIFWGGGGGGASPRMVRWRGRKENPRTMIGKKKKMFIVKALERVD